MMTEKQEQPIGVPHLNWEVGTAYDFFESLDVLHNPEMYDLRPSWAAGVRSRLPAEERKLLEEIQSFLWVPIRWIYGLPAPKDATTVLWSLRQIAPAERLAAITSHGSDSGEDELLAVYKRVAERRSWDQSDEQAIKELISKEKKEKAYLAQYMKALPGYLEWWARPDEFGELYLSALQAYFQVFFAEEERRIAPYLKDALERAQELSSRMSVPDLLVELSQGVHFAEEFKTPELVLAPMYWSTPLILWDKISPDSTMFLFGARPVTASLVPGEVVPDGLLRALKALADPTRLLILRYLNKEGLTPAQLSRKLRLRAPTVIHHLSTLRLAGLVHLVVDSEDNRLYTARLEAFTNTCSSLEEFLGAENKDTGD